MKAIRVKRRIFIKRYYRNHRPVRAHSKVIIQRKGIISPPYKKVFKFISEQPDEFAGQIDFEKDSEIERFTANKGLPDQVEAILDEDYELGWHTHPGMKNPLLGLSSTDLADSVHKKQEQAQLIMSKGNSVILVKTPRLNKLRKKLRTFPKLEKYFYNKQETIYENSTGEKDYLNNLGKMLKQEGFHIYQVPSKEKDILIPIKIKEPQKRYDE